MPRDDPADGALVMEGRVVTGCGDLARWMRRYADVYARAVGVQLEPGSLNVRLDRPWVMPTPEIRLETSEVGVGLGLVLCRINDERCWIVRTDNNNAGMGDHPLTLVEIVAPVHLRTALAVDDGDMVRIIVAGASHSNPVTDVLRCSSNAPPAAIR